MKKKQSTHFVITSPPSRERVRLRIEKLRTEQGLTQQQVAERLGTYPITISRLEHGKQGVSDRTLLGLARALGVGVSELFDDFDEERHPPPPGQKKGVAVVGYVRGGDNGYLEELDYPVGEGDGTVDFPSRYPNTYALKVQGDSMRPRIRPGDFIVVEPDIAATPGSDVVVRAKDGRKLLKVFLYQRHDEVTLGSINEEYAPMTLSVTQIESMEKVVAIVDASLYRP